MVTDVRLAILAESPSWALRQPDWVLDSMDSWNTKMHKASGLTDRCRASSLDEKSVEQLALDFLKRHAEAGESPMCGNSICQDRRFFVPSSAAFGAVFPLPSIRCEHAQNRGATFPPVDLRRL